MLPGVTVYWTLVLSESAHSLPSPTRNSCVLRHAPQPLEGLMVEQREMEPAVGRVPQSLAGECAHSRVHVAPQLLQRLQSYPQLIRAFRSGQDPLHAVE